MKKTIICRRDVSGRVLEQNAECIRFCGRQSGVTCTNMCAEHLDHEKTRATKKTTLARGRMIGDQFFDIVVSPDQEGTTTILLKADRQSKQAAIPVLGKFNLTKTEMVVAKMIGRGFTNREITEKLGVSLATVKTHINRIYAKLGDHPKILAALRRARD